MTNFKKKECNNQKKIIENNNFNQKSKFKKIQNKKIFKNNIKIIMMIIIIVKIKYSKKMKIIVIRFLIKKLMKK